MQVTYSLWDFMKLPRLKTVLLTPLILFAVFYLVLAMYVLLDDNSVAPLDESPTPPLTIAIFGASGTAGDGILKAVLASPDIGKIHVITRRTTPRMEEGVAAGKVQLTSHMDYLDYSAIEDTFIEVDAVYWAIGISTFKVDEETYSKIHVDFPMQFAAAWSRVSQKPDTSFHYISSSDISEESTAYWAREKVRAENSLFKLAEGSNMRVIAYRPDYIGPTEEEAQLGQNLMYWFFAPVRAAVRAKQIGQAMIEVTVRGNEFANGRKLGTGTIIRYSHAYLERNKDHQ